MLDVLHQDAALRHDMLLLNQEGERAEDQQRFSTEPRERERERAVHHRTRTVTHLLLLQDDFLLQHFDRVVLCGLFVSSQKNLKHSKH